MERYSEEPATRVRASDAERDDALRTLAAHYADGRLDQPEFDRRADAALVAVTRDQLRGLFADLPRERAAAPERPRRVRPPLPPVPVLLAVLLALAVVAVLHGLPPFPLIPLIFILSRRRRRWNREVRPWT
ncbi:DUF1707 domain-containing protein [Actinospica sp.]|uniref:DUF1707 SHOCT-like domain-containing protein n=1 Tax=Actinospica sp. TaxID=1872142 RepID=UPI002C10C049|nr:DUF1707 domain-containing protein [Actinospica sp.]HWG24378.1 DUF1707 domain-containing protein [Actinospica sp.]